MALQRRGSEDTDAPTARQSDWTTPRWLIARTNRMSCERTTAWLDQMQALGFETYYPMVRAHMKVPMRELTRHQRVSHETLMRPRVAPFLPQRVFVREDGPIDRLAIRRFPGFIGFLTSTGEPARILDRFITNLRRREIDGVIPGGTPVEYIFNTGDAVELVHPSLGAIPGKVLEPPGCAIEDIDVDTKLRLTIQMFGRPTVVVATVGDVRKV